MIAIKWTGSGQHFGFLNQPNAGFANYQVLVESVAPVIAAARGDDTMDAVVDEFLETAQKVFTTALDTALRSKMGLPATADAGDELFDTVKDLMRESRTDWTIFWRQLTYVMKEFPDLNSEDYGDMMAVLEVDSSSPSSPFYEELTSELRRQWIAWIKDWRETLKSLDGASGEQIYELMRTSNPKYVLREWMLVDAYSTATDEDYTILKELYKLIQDPYAEGTKEEIAAYYRRAPDSAVGVGGTAFMS